MCFHSIPLSFVSLSVCSFGPLLLITVLMHSESSIGCKKAMRRSRVHRSRVRRSRVHRSRPFLEPGTLCVTSDVIFGKWELFVGTQENSCERAHPPLSGSSGMLLCGLPCEDESSVFEEDFVSSLHLLTDSECCGTESTFSHLH